jgi:hypothetical protein
MRSIVLTVLVVTFLVTTVFAETKEPSEQVEALVKRLPSGKIEGVFIDFFANSIAAEQKPTEIRAMDGQAKAALDFYGRTVNYEIVETKKMGNSLITIKWITMHKNEVPLFWNGTFYKRNGKWEPFGVFFFDNPIKAGF